MEQLLHAASMQPTCTASGAAPAEETNGEVKYKSGYGGALPPLPPPLLLPLPVLPPLLLLRIVALLLLLRTAP